MMANGEDDDCDDNNDDEEEEKDLLQSVRAAIWSRRWYNDDDGDDGDDNDDDEEEGGEEDLLQSVILLSDTWKSNIAEWARMIKMLLSEYKTMWLRCVTSVYVVCFKCCFHTYYHAVSMTARSTGMCYKCVCVLVEASVAMSQPDRSPLLPTLYIHQTQ